jgi:PAS domain S-box-containing protein
MVSNLQENDLLNGLEHFQFVLEAVPALIACVDQNGTYLFANQGYATWYGRTRPEVMGKNMRDVVGEAAWTSLSPHLNRALAGEDVRFEEFISPKSGGPAWMGINFNSYRNSQGVAQGVIVLIRDITDRKRTEARLHKEHELNSLLLSTTAALIVVLDTDGKIVHFNRAFESATEYPFEEVKGRAFSDMFLYPDEAGHVRVLLQHLHDGRSVSKHVNFIRTRSGRRRMVEWSSSVLFDERGQLEYIIGTGLDITDRRELEQELLAISDLERQRIGQDLHDGLGQRLTALELFAYSVKEEVRKHAPFLLEECEQMSRELRETVRQARILSHGLAPVSFEGDGLLLALEDLAQNTSSMTKVECSFQHDGRCSLSDANTSMHLYRIAQEVVNNALRHARPTRIEIKFADVSGERELIVRDNGTGMSQTAGATSGMGLKLIQHRAELMGATISIDSAPNRGTAIKCRVRGTP